ncbi:hypothetical protein SAMN05421829_11921 [Aromatoleum tolulyticum]|uniref:Uncharacterized protein n=1 Tax=Aromatoleum tolulyticum TaxID=34027 RepID=A0A1N7BRG3_9RHOO|nr:hypothetical protein SAMN05421829_11921 [Aromatoleum tolulyticum]
MLHDSSLIFVEIVVCPLFSERPSEQAPRMAIHHCGEVTPLIAYFQIRDVTDPDLIGTLYVDFVCLALNTVEELRKARHTTVKRRGTGANTVLTHQALYASLTDTFACFSQCRMHARTAVGLATGLIDRLNLVQQTGVLIGTSAGRALSPSIIARGADTVEPAHRPHRERFLTVLDEGKDVPFRAEVNAMAFFNSSCSSFRRS